MSPIARCLAVALSFVILSSPPLLQGWIGGDTRPFIVATIALALAQAFVVWSWKARPAPAASGFWQMHRIGRFAIVTVAALAGAWLLLDASHAWLHQIFTIPHDPQRADMLIVVQEGLRRMLQGRNPYTIYHVPWEAPLPYGPMLWGPYAIPMALGADVRFLTVAGELFVPAACAVAAVMAAARGRPAASAACLIMAAAMCVNPDLARFASIGHTPAYWPLLALFAWLVVGQRWYAAAIVLGLLIVARTTMVAMVPVLVMAAWRFDRKKGPAVVVLLALAAALPFLPFAIWDARALGYAMYGSYQNVIKGFVWTSTTWVQHTIGLTGVLLSNGLGRFVDAVQIVVMALLYVAAWRALGRGYSPVAWMGAALFAFSMTTLWPVTYVYFDVFLMLAAALAAGLVRFDPRLPRSLAAWWTAAAATASVLVAGGAFFMLPASPMVDAGDPDARAYLRSGFAGDEREGDRTFAWVEGRHASILLPRRSRGAAAVEVICHPALTPGAAGQRMSAVVNGALVGDITLTAGWNDVSINVPARDWRIGVNELALTMGSTASPADTGANDDRRQLSVAIDRVAVRPAP